MLDATYEIRASASWLRDHVARLDIDTAARRLQVSEKPINACLGGDLLRAPVLELSAYPEPFAPFCRGHAFEAAASRPEHPAVEVHSFRSPRSKVVLCYPKAKRCCLAALLCSEPCASIQERELLPAYTFWSLCAISASSMVIQQFRADVASGMIGA